MSKFINTSHTPPNFGFIKRISIYIISFLLCFIYYIGVIYIATQKKEEKKLNSIKKYKLSQKFGQRVVLFSESMNELIVLCSDPPTPSQPKKNISDSSLHICMYVSPSLNLLCN